MADALVSIQIIPRTRNEEDTYSLVDEAIQVIADSKSNTRSIRWKRQWKGICGNCWTSLTGCTGK